MPTWVRAVVHVGVAIAVMAVALGAASRYMQSTMYLSDGTKVRDGNEYLVLFLVCVALFPVSLCCTVTVDWWHRRRRARRRDQAA